MDKASQLIFTANGHMMGERFYNSGPLDLKWTTDGITAR